MSDFIFPCSSCGKDIQCDDSYAGMQINCPICQAAIIVPQPSAPPTPAPMRPSMMMGSTGRAYQPPPPKKSGALRMTLIIVVVCAVLGSGGWYFYSKKKEAAQGNPAAQVETPNAQATIQALSTLTKVQSAYTNMTSAKADGTIAVTLDLSKITIADLIPNNPNATRNAQNADRRQPGMPNNVAVNVDFSMKSAESNWYCFNGEVVAKMDGMDPRAANTTVTNTFAFWSSDKGTFSFSDSHERGQTPVYQKLRNVNPGDNPAEQLKNIQELFKDPANLTKIVKDLGQTADEPVNGQDCHTLTAKILGQKVKIWVDKTSYLVSQLEITLGGAISDADIDDAFSLVAMTGITNMPPAQMDMVKAQLKPMKPVVTKIRGTITMTYKNFEINPVLAADDFNYPVPAGVRLITPRSR